MRAKRYKFNFGLFNDLDKKPQSDSVNVLDVGCGNNPMPDATHIMDIDHSLGYKALFWHDANIVPYPFNDGFFDKIYLHHILEHLDVEDVELFHELYRILKMYGKVEIVVPNSLFIYHRILYFFGIIPCDFILCHKKHYSFQQLKHNLRNANFKIYEINNKWVFNPFRNFTNPHIKIIAKKVG